MKPSAQRIARLLFLLAAGQAAGQASVTTKSGLVVTDLSFGPNEWTHGTIEHRYLIENPSPQRRTVTVELPGKTYSGGGSEAGLRSLSGTVTVDAGAKAVLSMLQPPVECIGDSSFAVMEKGFPKETIPRRAKDFQTYSVQDAVSVLLSKGLSAERLAERLTAFAPAEGHTPGYHNAVRRGSMTATQPLRLEREPAAWPSDWLAYAGFDGCMLAMADYEKMPVDVRTGLRSYVAAGGMVTFVGADAVPPGWSEADRGWIREAGALNERYTEYGFGKVQAPKTAELANITSNRAVGMMEAWLEREQPWRDPSGRYQARGFSYAFEQVIKDIPVQGGVQVPANIFLLVLLTFVLLAGPGAVIYACRTNRRIWLLGIVPAVSVAFSAAIFVFALLSEGVTPYVRRQAVTLLDQTRRQALTLGALAVYAPVTLRGGLEFDLRTEVTPLLYGANQESKSIVWGRCQHFQSDWVRPRMAAFFRVRRSEERAERLIVTEQGEGVVEVVNALAVPIRRLSLRDSRGCVYLSENVTPGEKRVLSGRVSAEAGKPSAYEKVRSMYRASLSPGWGITALLETGAAALQPDARSYVAVLEGCPFIENPLGYCEVKETAQSLVAGRY